MACACPCPIGRVGAGRWARMSHTSPFPAPQGVPFRRGPINNWTEASGNGAIMALDPRSGQVRWKYETTDVAEGGILTTASDLLFHGGREGYFKVLDAQTGTLLWKANLGGQIMNGPITYAVNGEQYVATIAGNALVAFALRD